MKPFWSKDVKPNDLFIQGILLGVAIAITAALFAWVLNRLF